MEKVKEFFSKYGIYILLVVLTAIFFLTIAILFHNNNNLRRNEKAAKIEIKALHKYNKDLEKEIKLNRDSVKIYHDLALFYNSKDTIYINQIKYLKTKTNEEISHLHKLPIDSQYSVFSALLEQYSETRFD